LLKVVRGDDEELAVLVLEFLLRVYHDDGFLPNFLCGLYALRIGLFLVRPLDCGLNVVETDVAFGHSALEMHGELETYHFTYFRGNVKPLIKKTL
jgi:hypothetical protein